MKKYAVTALSIVCAVSLAGNAFLYQRANTLNGQLDEQAAKTADLSEQLEESNTNMADLQAAIEALQASHEMWNADTPEQAQAEQSTQGAADKTQQRPLTDTEAIQQEVQKEHEATTPSKPANSDKWQSSSSEVQNPSQDDVNDLLNDILGGGGSTSTPSGGDGYLGGPRPGSDALGGGYSPEDFEFK